MTPPRRVRWAALIAMSAAVTACGPCLLVIRQDVVFVGPHAEELPGEIEWREPEGLLSPKFGGFPLTLVCEPADVIFSTIIALNAMFDSDRSVRLGPIGWIAALTPFATLVPSMDVNRPPPARIQLDGSAIQQLQDGTAEARAHAVRTSLADQRIGAARLRSGPR